MKKGIRGLSERTVGLDLGDKYSLYFVVDGRGEALESGRVKTTPTALSALVSVWERSRVVLEVGTHSPWVSRVVAACGHEVVVANARQVHLISRSARKNDRLDAERLARLGRVDPELLRPLQHRGPQAQADLGLLRSRDALVRARTRLVVHTRGMVKSWGGRLPSCSAESFHKRVSTLIPTELREALTPLLETIAELTGRIRQLDRSIEELAATRYPETECLRQIPGVGTLTALGYVLTLEDPRRFAKSRDVGGYLGLVPGQDQSGDRDPQLRITKAGDPFLRRLLVQAAHYILGPFGPDTDLRRFGEAIRHRGGKYAKKRAAVAVARKLAVLLHRLWITGEAFEPLYNATQRALGAERVA